MNQMNLQVRTRNVLPAGVESQGHRFDFFWSSNVFFASLHVTVVNKYGGGGWGGNSNKACFRESGDLGIFLEI